MKDIEEKAKGQADEIKKLKAVVEVNKRQQDSLLQQYNQSQHSFSVYKIETLNKVEGYKDDLQEQLISADKFVAELS